MASIVLGIAAVVSVESFSENLQYNIDLQSKSLMGADFVIDSRHPANDKVQAIIDSLGGADATEINFSSMCLFPKNGQTKFVRVVGMEGDFPFYGVSAHIFPHFLAVTLYVKDIIGDLKGKPYPGAV